MKSWVNRNQAEFYVDNAEVSGDTLTVVMHCHLNEPRTSAQDNKRTESIRDLVKRRVLVTFAEFMAVKGLNENRSDIVPPNAPGGDGK